MMFPLGADERALAEAARAAVSGAGRDGVAGGVVGPGHAAAHEAAPGDVAGEDAAARAALARLAGAGLLRHAAPPEGVPSAREVCAIREALAHGDGLADVMFVMQGLGSTAIALAGSAALRSRWLPEVASGRVVAAFALTEPEAGSDVGAIATRAARDGDGYVLDGEKCFITNAGIAGLYTVFARTGEAGSGSRGLSAFAVDAASDGLHVERTTVIAPHPIGRVIFSGCRVPAACRLGDEGAGHDLALRVLDRFRPTVGAAAVGFGRRALEAAIDHAKRRRQFGKPLSDQQAIRFKLADMATHLHAASLLVWRAACLADAPPDVPDAPAASPGARRRAAAMAKLYATEAAQRIVDEAVQIHGGLGVTRGQVVERLYRDVRALRIYEGTSEIQRLVIARTLLRDDG
jgi:acyl-CoA dehydrogenase